jgi:type III restriction enzyme
MDLKRYQVALLDRTRRFLERLAAERAAGNKRASLEAWEAVTGSSTYRSRRNGLGRDLPDAWIKVPTGGGKTLLATQILGQVYGTIHRDRNGAGLALWIVPSDAIYRQTLKALRDRTHPYRMSLEQAVGRRVDVWEKHEAQRLTPTRLLDCLNVLLLKLPSANRSVREALKLFQDSGGNIVQHFPAEDDAEANRALKARIPNLEMIADDLAMTSLGNLVRLCEPPVVLDEGHRALSELAQETLAGFNPSILVRLSATPPEEANVLARVTGAELLEEEMIKLPINVVNSGTADWRKVLSEAHDKQRELERAAARIADPGGKAIRPIVLVQVERTGKDQRGGADLVHAEDAKEHLMQRLGVPEGDIKIKSSERDDIEGIDLLDEGCSVRWIVTKSALQEGWDCPFAYVLVSLSNSGSARAMTQLVGRVLRQPGTRRTKDEALNESYVFCRRAKAAEVVKQVKAALEQEGYEGHLYGVVDRSGGAPAESRPVAKMRPEFRSLYRPFAGKVYLPRFCVRDADGEWSGLDYFRHLVAEVDVDAFDYPGIDWSLGAEATRGLETRHRVTLGAGASAPVAEREIAVLDDDARAKGWVVANLHHEHFGFRELRTIVDRCVARVLEREPALAGRLALAKYALRDRVSGFLEGQTDLHTERAFLKLLEKGRIEFYLECRECRFELPPQVELRSRKALTDDANRPLAKTLFEWAEEERFNPYERDVALEIDKHPEVLWWYRNAVGRECFSIQGYRRDRIYPDFLVQRGRSKKPEPTVYVVESKGSHLGGDPRTLYTRDLGRLFDRVGQRVSWQKLGEGFEGSTFRFQVLDQDTHGAWRQELRALLGG